MITRFKRSARKSKRLIVAFGIYKNWRMKRLFAAGQIETLHGSSHSGKSIDASVTYVEEQFADYLTYGDLKLADLAGKRVLELGFGDNVGVALKFLAAGAQQLVCVDKFYSQRDSAHERAVYQALRRKMSENERREFDDAITIDDKIAANPERLKCINGVLLESTVKNLAELQQPFDLIISRAVIEEIYQPDALFAAMDSVLRPGGLMLHKIDLSDYGMFRDAGMHPLTFLTISPGTYQLMASDSGIPNRKRMEYYRDIVSNLGYHSKIFVTGILGQGPVLPHKEKIELGIDYPQSTLDLINEIRPRLCRDYRNASDEQLLIDGIFLVSRKEGAGARGNN